METRFWSHPPCLRVLVLFGLLQAPIPLAAQDWLPAQTIAPPGVQAGDHSGWSVAMSDDTLAVASLRLRLTAGDRSGVVDLFQRIENSWTPAATLAPPAGEDLGLFGWSVALDGDTLAVGAIQETVGADVHAGAVYVYRRAGAAGGWTLEERLTANESAPGANFGYAVDVSGSTLVVGARFHPGDGGESGSAYVFQRSETGDWSQVSLLAAGRPTRSFGAAVAIDDRTILVGAPEENLAGLAGVGAAYLFTRPEGDLAAWSPAAPPLTAPAPEVDGRFGYDVAADGGTLAVSALPLADSPTNGTVFVYVDPASDPDVLTSDGPMAGFGRSLSLRDDLLIVGAAHPSSTAGQAVIFLREAGTWSAADTVAPDPSDADLFGWDVALTRRLALVGAPQRLSGGIATGGAFLYGLAPVIEGLSVDGEIVTSVTLVEGEAANLPVIATNEPGLYEAANLPNDLAIDAATGVISGVPRPVEGGPWIVEDGLIRFDSTVTATNESAAAGRDLVFYIEDATPPVIALLGDNPALLECPAPYVEPGATALDLVDGDLSDGITIDASAVMASLPGTYSVTYDVTDASGNGAVQVTRMVTVQDTTPPVITLVGDNPLVIEAPGDYMELGATAADSCEGDVSDAIVIDAAAVDPSTPGTYTVTYNVADSQGNAAVEVTRSVVVQDTTAPVISLLGDNPVILECPDPYVEPGATATDAVDGDLSAAIVADASGVDVETPGEYTVLYNVEDAAGNAAATVTRMVIVQDTTPPVLTLLGDNPQRIEAGAGYSEPGATAFDSCEGDVSDAIVIDATAVDASTPGTYTVTYNVADSQGNAAVEMARSVVVEDTTAPVISLLGENPLILECPEPYVEPGATATDAVDGDLSDEVTIDASAVDWETPGTYDVTYNVTDASGNPAMEAIRSVVVQDTMGPVITLLGENPQVVTIPGEDYIEMGATAEDACEGAIEMIEIDASAINLAVPGDYPVIYTASDSAGNESEPATRTVTVRIDPSLRVFFADFDADPEIVDGIEGVSVSYDWAGVTTEESVEGYAGIGAERPDGGFDGFFLRNATPFPGDAITLAISSEDFDGPENPSGEWTYGYRNVDVSTDPEDYDPVADFIPFSEADGWVFDGFWFQDSDAGPSDVEIGSTSVVPDVDGEDPTLTQWAIRRWTASFTGRVQIDWQMVGMIEPCGTGVTGAVHLNGVRVDSATIPSDTSISRTVYLEVAAGEVVDLIHSPRGLDGVVDEVCDNIANAMTIIAPPQPEATTLQLVGLDSLPGGHTEIDINFLLAVIDRWDGIAGEGAADFLEISIAEFPDFEWRSSFDNSAAFAEEPATVNAPEGGVQLAFREDLGFSPAEDDFADSAYAVSLTIPRDALTDTDSLTITWRSRGSGWEGTEDEIANESWAIENVEISFRDPTMMGVVAGEPPSPGMPADSSRLSGEPAIEIDAITGDLRLFWRPAGPAGDASDTWIEYSPTLEPGSWIRLSEGPVHLPDGWRLPVEPENHAGNRRGFYRFRAEAKEP